jgi:hypothetical protein
VVLLSSYKGVSHNTFHNMNAGHIILLTRIIVFSMHAHEWIRYLLCEWVCVFKLPWHILKPALITWRTFYPTNFLLHVNACTKDMVTFTALAKIYSTKRFCNTKGSWAEWNFYPMKIFHVYSTHKVYSTQIERISIGLKTYLPRSSTNTCLVLLQLQTNAMSA